MTSVSIPDVVQNSQATTASNRRQISLVIAAAVAYCALLITTISNYSLWTDEAFSAYLASQKDVPTFVSTIVSGDSSDLQAAGHYLYIFLWSRCLGHSEFALRAANIPFIIVFVFALVWMASRVFRARWSWLSPAALPFFWYYASEARAYFALTAFSTVCFSALLAYLQNPSERERRWLPWLILANLLLGAFFHMLMLLAALPMLVILWFGVRESQWKMMLRDWKAALLGFSGPTLLYLAYLAWTFLRGAAYPYIKPGFVSMASVAYRFIGLRSFGPNGNYSRDFGPYLPMMIAASLAFGFAVAGLTVAARNTINRTRLLGLCWAFAAALLQVVLLSVYTGQQIEPRHLAALTPLITTLLLAAVSQPKDYKSARIGRASAYLLTLVWICGDYRMLFLPENKGEDFRAAVTAALQLHRNSNADIVLAADPPAGAYYGLDLESRGLCFPLRESCIVGFSKVMWPKTAPATYALQWDRSQIESWLRAHIEGGVPSVVIMSRSRDRLYANSAWWPILRSRPSSIRYAPHGFWIYLLN